MVNKPFFSLVGHVLHSPIFCKPLILKIGPGADSQNPLTLAYGLDVWQEHIGQDGTKRNPSFKHHRKPKMLGLRFASSQPTRAETATRRNVMSFAGVQNKATIIHGGYKCFVF